MTPYILVCLLILTARASNPCGEEETSCSGGCCPFTNGVCCDNDNCCPSGYECAETHCQRSGLKFGPRFITFEQQRKEVDSCPTGTCPNTETCCSLGNGQWGCCPYPSADCCSDNSHCCPNGYTCDISKGQCIKASTAGLHLSLKMSLVPINEQEAGSCPDGTCPSSTTCCDLGDGQWGCCPYENADCCSDHSHCCPNGYTCDLSKGQCIHSSSEKMMVRSITPLLVASVEDSCPTGTCSSSETCCDLGDGQWGCCPYENADCCSDHSHCCPNGYTCDLSKGQCVHSTGVARKMIKVAGPEDSCPAGTCSSSETCCDLGNGQWGCCPYENADCCSDHSHCCPNGYTCDLSKGQCVHSSSPVFRALTRFAEEVVDSCPTGTCSSSETCCDLGDGQWGCCPYENADCCSDHSHCCPNGYTCDLSKGQCVHSTGFFRKMTPLAGEEEVDSCPAGTCSSSETCCDLGDGQWGCCPYENADCCSDHSHCCPNGYTCDLSKGQCVHSTGFSRKMTPLAGEEEIDSCPTGTCSSSETCCDLGDGQWGCCPYENADCCSDHSHCCPNGYTCDLSKGQCVHSTGVSRKMIKVAEPEDSCPTGTCSSSETCCDLGDGQWGCCPYENADCCSDHSHCCPNGYTCDISKGQCVHSTGVARKMIKVAEPEDSCPAGTCSSSETCCDLGDGQWGCCPYENADCCSDHSHCCPNGYTCDLSKGQCVHSTGVARKMIKVAGPEDSCPAGTCSSSETCCDLGDGQWGCCPYENADCCSDHSHCCPNGYTCDLSKGQCVHSNKKFTRSFSTLF